MRQTGPVLLGIAAGALVLSACGGNRGPTSGSGPLVVASFYPLAYVAQQVGGDHVTVDNLTSPGAEPHDLELEPRQIGEVQDADLVVYESGFQAAVDDAVGQSGLADAARIDVAELVDLKPAEGAGNEDSGSADSGSADETGLDPHVWLDPTNMITITEAVTGRLVRLDDGHAQSYRRNGRDLVAELHALDRSYRAGLRNCETRKIVTSHAAFGYLAAQYDLEQVAIAGLDPGTEPSGAQLGAIARIVEDEGIGTIFTEELASPRIAETIADETGADTATLDPIEGLSDDTADQTYLTLMRRNLHAIQKADHCHE